jgi:hypothetical protein
MTCLKTKVPFLRPTETGEGETSYNDGKVRATVQVDCYRGQPVLSIFEFSSRKAGEGNARRALRRLRRHFPTILATSIGYEPADDSWKFWKKMYDEGLVDELYADENSPHGRGSGGPEGNPIVVRRKAKR